MEKANPIADAISSYSQLRAIGQRDQLIKQEGEDRAYNRKRQARQDAMQEEVFKRQQEEFKKKDELDKLKAVKYWLTATPPGVDPLQAIPDESKPWVQPYIDKDPYVQRYYSDPEFRMKEQDAIKEIEGGLDMSQGPPDMKRVIKGVNTIYGPELNKGLADDGKPAKSKVLDKVVLSEDGKTFTGTLLVTRQDGSQYESPLTEGRDSNPNAPIKWIPISQIGAMTKMRQGMIDYVNARMIERGDESVMKDQAKAQERTRAITSALQAVKGVSDDKKREVLEAIIPAIAGGDMPAAVGDTVLKAAMPDEKERKLMKVEGGVGKGGAKQDMLVDSEGNVVYSAPPVYPKPTKEGGGKEKMSETEKYHWEMFKDARKQYDKLKANLGKTVVSYDDFTGNRTSTTVTKKDLQPYINTMNQAKAAIMATGKYVDPDKKKAVGKKESKKMSSASQPDLATAQRLIQKYGSKEAAKAAWDKGER